MTHESIWFDQPKYEEAESHYQLHLASINGPTPASKVIFLMVVSGAKKNGLGRYDVPKRGW